MNLENEVENTINNLFDFENNENRWIGSKYENKRF
jgi:hypothetical protein